MGNQPSAPKITAEDRAIFQLKQQRDKIKQYQRKLSLIRDKQTKLAKKAILNKQPDRAKLYLRLKKQQEATITKTYDQLDNLEKLIGTIEFKLIEKDVMYGLQQGNAVLKQLNAEMNVDKIDKIMDDLEEERLQEQEISQTLGLGSGLSRVDEDAVDDEFERLNKEINKTSAIKQEETKEEQKVVGELPSAPKDQIMPNVPSDTPLSDKKENQNAELEKEKPKQEQSESEPIAA
ncbi:conserved hypothetical protein [Lodderomyces elongisporus NRRL YB-4239]|uniref:Charged multivesicular body protein 6 n=1 Tax=Lodderomyces elongisporus (strain ATCC 11503 / CBS 2605 / JCM 1781 / NBRC 1676 / NRRL YB-4239) TaxID=379508 RepID=A5DVC5_LODEL|nr:conserved hypothetical protein [Lodderomyces elongisporus NRRL YB-4239]